MKVAFLALAGWSCGVNAAMYDAFSPELAAPAKCKHGCAKWSTQDASIWNDGKVPVDAGNKCAHVGSQVNSKYYGAWCFCAQSEFSNRSLTVTDDHPLDGMTMVLKNKETAYIVSFAYTDGPGSQDQGKYYMRAYYTNPADEMPLLFKAVDGKKDTYKLQNQYTGYNDWVDVSSPGFYLRADASEKNAMQLQFIEEDDGSFLMMNEANGKYVALDGYWMQTTGGEASSALRVKMAPPSGGGGGEWDYCSHGESVPEQINIQIAGQDAVVASWVTFEPVAPTVAPTLHIGKDQNALQELKGVTHVHKTPAGRVYYMHFVRAEKLTEHARYHYQVQSGGKNSVKSQMYSFRAPYSTGETKLDIYGDMGIYSWNNLEQLFNDCVQGNTADLIVHMGDISYNMGDNDEARADGFFSAFQKTIANCPWLPNVGNHEYYSSEELARYLDGTWQKWGPIAGGVGSSGPVASTATSALGAFLTTSMHHGPGLMGNHPSNTSRYFSLDFGLVHLIALDMNMYFGADPCGEPCRKAQLSWLEDDLKMANQNREAVPWVLAFSHYPLYCSGCNAKQVSSAYYASDEAEYCGTGNASASSAFVASLETSQLQHANVKLSASQSSDAMIKDMQPLFEKFSLDLYLGGHWHYYESLWPVTKEGSGNCKSCAESSHKSFDKPQATVHVTTGNGGPPSKDTFCESGSGAPDCDNIPATRKQTNEYSFGRVIAHNRTHLTFQQVLNIDGSLFDEWTIHQPDHPFAPAGHVQHIQV